MNQCQRNCSNPRLISKPPSCTSGRSAQTQPQVSYTGEGLYGSTLERSFSKKGKSNTHKMSAQWKKKVPSQFSWRSLSDRKKNGISEEIAIEVPRNQTCCGSCWAFTSASSLGDRYAVALSYDTTIDQPSKPFVPSAGYTLTCANNSGCPAGSVGGGQGCSQDSTNLCATGGNIQVGLSTLASIPTASEECFPYSLFVNCQQPSCRDGDGECLTKKQHLPGCIATLKNLKGCCHDCCDNPESKKLFGVKTGTVGAYGRNANANDFDIVENMIKKDILANGPMPTGFIVQSDFQNFLKSRRTGKEIYKSGQNEDGGRTTVNVGGHAVVITGWGIGRDNANKRIPFWEIRNSWGSGYPNASRASEIPVNAKDGFFRVATSKWLVSQGKTPIGFDHAVYRQAAGRLPAGLVGGPVTFLPDTSSKFLNNILGKSSSKPHNKPDPDPVVVNTDCKGHFTDCKMVESPAGSRAPASCISNYIIDRKQSGSGKQCDFKENSYDCRQFRNLNEGKAQGQKVNRSKIPSTKACDPPVNCEGKWGSCDEDCKKSYSITTPQDNNGLPCKFENGATQSCLPGEGSCPKPDPQDCRGSFSQCDADCKKVFKISTPQKNSGISCSYKDGETENCDYGDGLCKRSSNDDRQGECKKENIPKTISCLNLKDYTSVNGCSALVKGPCYKKAIEAIQDQKKHDSSTLHLIEMILLIVLIIGVVSVIIYWVLKESSSNITTI